MKAFAIEVRVKNNLLRERRQARDLTVRALAKATNVNLATVYGLESMHDSPIARSGEWSRSAQLIAAFFQCMPEDIWPPEVLCARGGTRVVKLDAGELRRFAATTVEAPALPDEILEQKEALARMAAVCNHNERTVLLLRLNGHSFREIGSELGLSSARVQQIQKRAFERMEAAEALEVRQVKLGLNARRGW